MTERPILFSAPMVRAILAGKKTQTRRKVDLDRLRVALRGHVTSDLPEVMPLLAANGVRRAEMNPQGAVSVDTPGGMLGVKPGEFDFVCPYATGKTHLANHGGGRTQWTIMAEESRLWVRETWADADRMYQGHENDTPGVIAYPADRSAIQFDAEPARQIPVWDLKQWNWDALKRRPSIHMPRWASRITLDVTSVRVERLQDISPSDACDEGIFEEGGYATEAPLPYPVATFKKLWDTINGKRANWQSNPWVWAISFGRVDQAASEAA